MRSQPQKVAGYGLHKYSQGVKQESQADFHPCARFEGPRPGYIFTAAERGVGYYRDTNAMAKPQAPPSKPPPPPSLPSSSDYAQRAKKQEVRKPREVRRAPLTAAEREARLRQFSQDAEVHETERRKRAKARARLLPLTRNT